MLRPFADKVHIREAFMVRFHPQWIDVREQLRGGAIGELRYMHMPCSYFNDNAENIRNIADIGGGALYDIGGGALYDIGCYAITAGRWFFEAEPERVVAAVDRDPVFGTDRCSSGVLDFGVGRHLVFTVSTQSARYQRIQLFGTRGRIEIQIPVNAPPDEACRYFVDDAGTLDGAGVRMIEVPPVDQYRLQAEAFSSAVRSQKPDARGLDEAIAGMRVIDALFASEKSGRFERP